MPRKPFLHNRHSYLLVLIAAACAAVAGAGAWFFLSPDDEIDGCENLLQDKRVQEALGDSHMPGMDCSGLGAVVREVTVGSLPGRHSLRQAQAMKDVLLAVDDEVTRAGGRLDPGVGVPLAESLADYASDTGVMLGMGSADYVVRSSASEPAWEDDDGVHMAVPRAALLRTVRAVSEEPKAFVVLRLAATRHAAEGLAAVERDATGAELTAPPARNAHTLGALDAVAEDVREDLGRDGAAEWEREVLQGLTKRIPEPSSYDEDPVHHLVGSWQRALLSGKAEGSRILLERQSADMVDVWSKERGLDGEVRRSLREDSLNSSFAARGNTGRELG